MAGGACASWPAAQAAADGGWQFGVDALHSRYVATESLAGAVLDREQGSLSGIRAVAGADGAWWSGEFDASWQRGRIAYAGQTQIGLPVRTTTQLTMPDLQALVGPAAFDAGSLGRVRARAGLDARRIDRDIEPSAFSGHLDEVMQTRFWVANAQWQMSLPGRPEWGGEVWVQGERAQHEALQVHSFGVFDPLTLHPQGSHAWLAGAAMTLDTSAGWQWRAGIDFGHLHYGSAAPTLATRSGVAAAVASYPGSNQSLNGWHVSIRHAL